MNKSDTITKIATALVKAQAEMGNASKDAKNPFFKSSYADLNAIREVALPPLNAVGISVLQPLTTENGKQYIETMLLHESGEYLSSLTEVVVAKQNDPQAAGSGISYARRYGLQSFLNIGAEDSDGEGAMNRAIPTKPAVKPVPLVDGTKSDVITIAKDIPIQALPDKPKPAPFRGKTAKVVSELKSEVKPTNNTVC